LVGNGAVSWVFVIAGILSNVPEGLSVAAATKKAGHPTGTARSRVRCPMPYS
jgi:zinc transporter ZupT